MAPYEKTGNTIKVHYAADPASFNGDLEAYDCGQNTPTDDGVYQREDLPNSGGNPSGDCQPATVSSPLMY